MSLNIAVQMDPIERINIKGDSTFALLLEAQKRGHAHRLLHPGPARAARRAGVRDGAAAQGARPARRSLHAGRAGADGARHLRRRAAAAGPAVRSRLHHQHAYARARPSQDAGGQRSGAGAQRAGKDLRDGISRPDAADADHARPRRDQGVPRRARRHRDEAALRQGRRGGVPAGEGRPQLRFAVRSLHRHLPRAVGGAEVPAGGEGRRQAHHPGRRRVRRRGQPRAGARRSALQHGARRHPEGNRPDRRASARSARASGRRCASAGSSSSAST